MNRTVRGPLTSSLTCARYRRTAPAGYARSVRLLAMDDASLAGPLSVQSDKTLLLEVDHERADDCRKAIAPFAELERSPEHIHTYRLTPLGAWKGRGARRDAAHGVG